MFSTAPDTSRLLDVATVQPGYMSRGRVESTPAGSYRLLQARDVTDDSGILLDQAIRFDPGRKPARYRVNRGDVLVIARGQEHRAHHIDQELSDTLAAATFYIVRTDVRRVLPGYLAWWLNQPRAQAEIDASSRGTNIAYISRDALEALPVPLPPLSVQQNIERVTALWRMKKHLQLQVDQKREHYMQAVCRQAVRQPGKQNP